MAADLCKATPGSRPQRPRRACWLATRRRVSSPCSTIAPIRSLVPQLITTPRSRMASERRVVPQLYYYYRFLGLMSEYVHEAPARASADSVPPVSAPRTLQNSAWQVQGYWFITGEDEGYDTRRPAAQFRSGRLRSRRVRGCAIMRSTSILRRLAAASTHLPARPQRAGGARDRHRNQLVPQSELQGTARL